jgi:hypothetical protein
MDLPWLGVCGALVVSKQLTSNTWLEAYRRKITETSEVNLSSLFRKLRQLAGTRSIKNSFIVSARHTASLDFKWIGITDSRASTYYVRALRRGGVHLQALEGVQ